MQHGNRFEHRTVLLGESQAQTAIEDGQLFEIKVVDFDEGGSLSGGLRGDLGTDQTHLWGSWS